MMLKRKLTPQDSSQPGVPRRRGRAGSTVLAAFAGVSVLCVGTAAGALAAVQSTGAAGPSGVCQPLPPPPTTGPGPSPSPSPSPTSSGNASLTELCISVQATSSSVQPGQAEQFVINVWPTGGSANNVTVQVSGAPTSFGAPTFNTCANGDGTATCTVGTLQASQTTQVRAQFSIPTSAPGGQTASLSGTGTGVATGSSTSGSVSSQAGFTVLKPTPTPTPTPTGTRSSNGHGHSSGSGSGGSTPSLPSGLGQVSPLGGLLPLAAAHAGAGSGANAGSLFPTISPTSGSSGSASARDPHSPYRARTVADILPLNSRQLGSQIAGLVVLAIGIVIALARVSLRKPKTQDK